jgi:hypothetical protein
VNETNRKSATVMPSIILTNAQSLTIGKAAELQLMCTEDETSVVMVTETWFSSIKNTPLPNFKQYSVHRQQRSHGGCAIFTKDLICQHLKSYDYSSDTMTSVWIKVTLSAEQPPIIYGCIYHPPNANQQCTLDYLATTLTDIFVKHPRSSVVFGGDFNTLDCCILENTFKLTNVVIFPTRGSSKLDKVFTNNSAYVSSDVAKKAPLGKSDHASVYVKSVSVAKPVFQNIERRRITPGAKVMIKLDGLVLCY